MGGFHLEWRVCIGKCCGREFKSPVAIVVSPHKGRQAKRWRNFLINVIYQCQTVEPVRLLVSVHNIATISMLISSAHQKWKLCIARFYPLNASSHLRSIMQSFTFMSLVKFPRVQSCTFHITLIVHHVMNNLIFMNGIFSGYLNIPFYLITNYLLLNSECVELSLYGVTLKDWNKLDCLRFLFYLIKIWHW